MNGEIEVFEFLKAKSSIKGIDIRDLQMLLTDAYKGKTYKNYTIKMISCGSILIYDRRSNNNILLKCVSQYYKTTNNTCERIRKELNSYNVNRDSNAMPMCSECYLKYIEKIKNGEI